MEIEEHNLQVGANSRYQLASRGPVERVIWVIGRRRDKHNVTSATASMLGMQSVFEIDQMYGPRNIIH